MSSIVEAVWQKVRIVFRAPSAAREVGEVLRNIDIAWRTEMGTTTCKYRPNNGGINDGKGGGACDDGNDSMRDSGGCHLERSARHHRLVRSPHHHCRGHLERSFHHRHHFDCQYPLLR